MDEIVEHEGRVISTTKPGLRYVAASYVRLDNSQVCTEVDRHRSVASMRVPGCQ